jgi:hypothetical protein
MVVQPAPSLLAPRCREDLLGGVLLIAKYLASVNPVQRTEISVADAPARIARS